MEKIGYTVHLKENVDADVAISALEDLADGLNLHRLDLKAIGMTLVSGSADQATYESVFDCKVDYVTRTIPNLNRGPYEVQEWKEITAPQVPKGLEQYIDTIQLIRPMYLTD